MSTRKAIFLDIDGTLLNRSGVMPASANEALKLAKANGHELVICSGRAMVQISPAIDRSFFNGFITVAGSSVYRNGESVFKQLMTNEQLDILTTYFEENSMPYFYQADDAVYTSKSSLSETIDAFIDLGYTKDELLEIFGSITICDNPRLADGIEKALYYRCRKTAAEVSKDIGSSFLIQDSSFKVSRFCDGEITCAGVHKGLGMQKYIEAAGIAREDTIAIGDGPNDFEMIDFAGIGICMGNGVDQLKERSDYVTTGINDDGIFNALKHYGII